MSAAATPLPKKTVANQLTSKELNLLTKTSNLSATEVQEWFKEFLEKNPSGKFDKAGFTQVYKKLSPKETDEGVNKAFTAADKNGDGSLDFNEFLLSIAVGTHSATADERLPVIFDLWDVSNDGKLDVNELAHLISAMYDRAHVSDRQGDKNPTARAKEIIKKLDASGDKKLNLDEFVKGLKDDEVIAGLLAPK